MPRLPRINRLQASAQVPREKSVGQTETLKALTGLGAAAADFGIKLVQEQNAEDDRIDREKKLLDITMNTIRSRESLRSADDFDPDTYSDKLDKEIEGHIQQAKKNARSKSVEKSLEVAGLAYRKSEIIKAENFSRSIKSVSAISDLESRVNTFNKGIVENGLATPTEVQDFVTGTIESINSDKRILPEKKASLTRKMVKSIIISDMSSKLRAGNFDAARDALFSGADIGGLIDQDELLSGLKTIEIREKRAAKASKRKKKEITKKEKNESNLFLMEQFQKVKTPEDLTAVLEDYNRLVRDGKGFPVAVKSTDSPDRIASEKRKSFKTMIKRMYGANGTKDAIRDAVNEAELPLSDKLTFKNIMEEILSGKQTKEQIKEREKIDNNVFGKWLSISSAEVGVGDPQIISNIRADFVEAAADIKQRRGEILKQTPNMPWQEATKRAAFAVAEEIVSEPPGPNVKLTTDISQMSLEKIQEEAAKIEERQATMSDEEFFETVKYLTLMQKMILLMTINKQR